MKPGTCGCERRTSPCESCAIRAPRTEASRPPVDSALALGLSGFASLTLQVVWTRLAALILGPTTYAFSVVVAVSIGGLAAGSALGSRLARGRISPCWALPCACCCRLDWPPRRPLGVDWALLVMAELVAAKDTSFNGLLIRQALLVAALLAPISIAFGAAFPFGVAVGTKTDEKVVADLGLIYAVNTSGAIPGALLAGFVLIPLLGLHDTIRAVNLRCCWRACSARRGARAAAAPVCSASPHARWYSSWDLPCRRGTSRFWRVGSTSTHPSSAGRSGDMAHRRSASLLSRRRHRHGFGA